MSGSWSELSYRKGYLNGAYSRPVGLVKTFIADAADHSIPADEPVEGVSGLLTGIDVEFGTTGPNALVVAIKSVGGLTLFTSESITASGRIEVSPPVDICGGMKILCTGNTTNSASATVIPILR